MKKIYDTVIIGCGASGLMCASNAGSNVLVIDSNSFAGNKIKISGGGRCNFTNLYVSEKNYISHNPKFLKSVLANYKPQDSLDLLDENGVEYYEKKLGQMFCKNSADDILNILIKNCEKNGVEFLFDTRVEKVEKKDEEFWIAASQEASRNDNQIKCKNLVIATGGASFAELGASDFALKIAQQMDVKFYPFSPALVPLIIKDENLNDLMGVSLPVKISVGEISFHDDILLTHFGLSGPAVLQISSYIKTGDKIKIDFVPSFHISDALINEKRKNRSKNLWQLLNGFVPKKLCDFLLAEFDTNISILEMKDSVLQSVGEKFNNFEVKIAGNKGLDFAEACCGGIDLNELNQYFEVRKNKGLYFIGEATDVCGWLGGFNIHFAMASGKICGEKLKNG